MLVVAVRPTQQSQQSRPSGQSNPSSAAGPSADQIESIRQQILAQPQALAQLRSQQPDVAATIHDPTRFREAMISVRRAQEAALRAEEARLAALDNDVNEENQAEIYKRIQQQNIDAEYEQVMETNPEFFASVTMLYIPIQVNGTSIKAFVDSGAQATIMSPDCAEKCGITRLIDKRFAGIARGVGTAKILGRVHRANIKIGDAELPCAFTVMEGKDVDMLLGLDMLKRYRACIDLQRNVLRFEGGIEIGFLGEAELPRNDFQEKLADEPTVEGPGGLAIGARSGAPKAGASSSTTGASGGGSGFQGAGRTLGSAPAPPLTGITSPPPRPNAPTPSHAALEFPQSDIDALMRIGATREQAVQALRATGGNAEYAASMLFDM